MTIKIIANMAAAWFGCRANKLLIAMTLVKMFDWSSSPAMEEQPSIFLMLKFVVYHGNTTLINKTTKQQTQQNFDTIMKRRT
jgi:hypothetical protein